MKKPLYWIQDCFYLFKGYSFMVWYRKPPKSYQKYNDKGKNPVILIPGISEGWGFLKILGDKIALAGHPVYVIPKLKFNLYSIPESATLVQEIIDVNKLDNIILVTHSKGGLIAKYMLVHFNKNSIRGIISIATPFDGSTMANIMLHSSYTELAETSKIISTLNTYQEVNSKIISIYPVFDNIILKKNSSYLKGAKNIMVDVKGHIKILFDEKTHNKVLQYVSQLSI